MTDKITLYTHPMSRGRIVRWMLEEAGADYEAKLLEYGTTMKAPEYLAINPMGKVPAIKQGEIVITETPAILTFLADAYPEAKLAPPPAERGAYYRWLFYVAGPLESALAVKALQVEPTLKQAGFLGFGTLSDVLNTLEKLVTDNDYIAAPYFTTADLYLASQLQFGMQFESIEPRDAFKAFVARCAARAAFQKANEADNALMAQLNS